MLKFWRIFLIPHNIILHIDSEVQKETYFKELNVCFFKSEKSLLL